MCCFSVSNISSLNYFKLSVNLVTSRIYKFISENDDENRRNNTKILDATSYYTMLDNNKCSCQRCNMHFNLFIKNELPMQVELQEKILTSQTRIFSKRFTGTSVFAFYTTEMHVLIENMAFIISCSHACSFEFCVKITMCIRINSLELCNGCIARTIRFQFYSKIGFKFL